MRAAKPLLSVTALLAAVALSPAQEPRKDVYGDPLPPGTISRIGTIRLRNSGELSKVAFSPDGKLLVTAAANTPLKVWDATTGAPVREIPLPRDDAPVRPNGFQRVDAVVMMTFRSEPQELYVLSNNGNLRTCDVGTGKWGASVARVGLAENAARSAWGRITPDRTHYFYTTFGTNVETTILALGKEGPVYRYTDTEFGRVGGATADNRHVVAYQADGSAKVWDLQTHKQVSKLTPPEGAFLDVDISPDGKIVAGIYGPKDPPPGSGAAPAPKFLGAWDPATGKEYFHTAWEGKSVGYAPDGSVLVSMAGNDILIADPRTGKLLHRLRGHGAPALYGYTFSTDGKRLMTGSRDHTAIVWDLTTGKPALDFDSPRGPVTVLAFSPDGKTLFAGCAEDHTGGLWDADTGKRVHRLVADEKGTPLCAAFTPDGKGVVVGYGVPRGLNTGKDWAARLWSLADGKLVREFGGHTDGVQQIAFSPDGKRLVTRDWGKDVRFWEPDTGKRTHELPWSDARDVVFSYAAADQLIAVGLDSRGTTEASNVLSGRLIAYWKADGVGSPGPLAVSPDGQLVASRERTPQGDEGVLLRRLPTGEVVCRLGAAGTVRPGVVAFSPNGKTVAAAGGLGAATPDTVRLFDAETGRELTTFRGHAGQVASLAFSPDGKRLATGSWDSTVLVWDLNAPK